MAASDRAPPGAVVSPKEQAIAIGLSEAGASSQQSPQENARRRKDTKAKERKGSSESTRAELYEKAKHQDVPGRSKMSKAELAKAVS